MPEPAEVSTVERLHNLATQLFADATTKRTSPLSHTEATSIHHIGDNLQLVREGETLVVWGQVETPKVGKEAVKTLYTISFVGDSPEPTTFLRWDDTRKDNGEGYSVPKRQRERIAEQLVGWLAAA